MTRFSKLLKKSVFWGTVMDKQIVARPHGGPSVQQQGRKCMKLVQKILRFVLVPIAILAFGALAACTQGVHHSFSFSMTDDNQDADVLNYRYGTSSRSVHPQEYELKNGRPFVYESVGGRLPRPDFLYVKWRNRSSGQVYEDTVDLRKRMPKDIEDHEVYFMIYGAQLYIYLISRDPLPEGWKAIGPGVARNSKTLLIYPDPSPNK